MKITRLVAQVDHTLGRHGSDDMRPEWISSLDESEGGIPGHYLCEAEY